ncbi:MAG: flavin reductase [Lachnospiraceae bacterium]|nr:flavin reductase [Lachnospiraceae bacterium]
MKANEITGNVFDRIGKQWMLVGAMKDGKSNAMTASWGGMGVMWGKNVVFVFVRETRYTKEFIDNGETFSLSFFDESRRGMLNYMGTVSGREEDKIAKAQLTVKEESQAPVFEEAELTLVCRKMYAQEMKEECFTDKEAVEKWYKDGNYHTMYVAEILDILQ